MKIAPISNNQPNFGVKLPKNQINNVIDSALVSDKIAGIPKVYTLLEKLDSMPGDKAEFKTVLRNSQSQLVGFKHDFNLCQLRIDGQLAEEGRDTYETLYNAVTSVKTKDGKKIRMPQAVFDTMWWKNADKIAQDLEQFFRE